VTRVFEVAELEGVVPEAAVTENGLLVGTRRQAVPKVGPLVSGWVRSGYAHNSHPKQKPVRSYMPSRIPALNPATKMRIPTPTVM
jgi:hypothetical protein